MSDKDYVLIVAPGIRVVTNPNVPPGSAFLVDANTVREEDLETGEVRYPLKIVGRIDNIDQAG